MLSVVFKLFAGTVLFLFAIHYIYYIISAIVAGKKNYKMQSDSAKYIKKRWKGGSIEPHPTDKALIVNYQLEAAVFGEPNNPMVEEKRECQKIIRLRTLNAKSNCAALAREVVDKCDLIHKSQLSEVEQIIFYLKNRKDNTGSDIADNNSRVRSASAMRQPSAANVNTTPPQTATTQVQDAYSIRNIEEYVELLYEDLNEKIRGSSLILKIARNPDNLEELEKNEAALSALSRVLREDWRKSLDLSTNIIYIFFCFSTYTKFHPVIVQYKIGSLCMDIIEAELRRYESMRNKVDTPKSNQQPENQLNNKDKLNKSSDDFLDIMNEEKPKEMEPPRRRIPELKQRPKSGNWSSFHSSMSSSLSKSQLLNNSYHEALSKMSLSTTESNKSNSSDALDTNSKKEEYDRLNKQLKIFAKKQEQLLRLAFYLLLNVAENVKLEEKMRRKNIVHMLVKCLDRQNIELLTLAVTFLKKLSIVTDNKNDMNELNITSKLPRLIQCGHPDLVHVTLKLVFNLSFDGQLRAKMIRGGYLPMLVMFLSDEKHHSIVVKILYHMSLDDKVKIMFSPTECVQMATDAIILNLNMKVDLDLISLCINLALNKKNAQIMAEGSRLNDLFERAFKLRDTLLMKLLRNISLHSSIHSKFIDHVDDLVQKIVTCEEEQFMIECLGILGNLRLPDLDYSQIVQKNELIPWIQSNLIPGNKMDDLILDTVVFVGTCSGEELCATLFCRANVVLSLIDLLKAKQEDDEIVLQIVYAFQQILKHESTRNYMIKETESPAYLIDLMHDKNSEIRKVCDFCMDIIALTDSDWATRIKVGFYWVIIV
ncbi:KIFAP3 family protein [Megaselia abdita]